MDTIEDKGDPVLVNFDSIPYFGNNNRTPAVLDINGHTHVVGSGQVNNSNRFPVRNMNRNCDRGETREELTVLVENVHMSYEPGKPILDNLSMHVKRGTM